MKKLIAKYKGLTSGARLAVLALLFLLLVGPTITFSRYIYDLILNRVYSSQNFYFRSDYLAENTPEYTLDNWGGDTVYPLTINMNSFYNSLKYATMDINYRVEYSCSGKATCSIYINNKTIDADSDEELVSVIPASKDGEIKQNSDTFKIEVNPDPSFSIDDEVIVEVKAVSTSPYIKELSAKFKLKSNVVGLTYEITDNKSDVFSTLRLTNSVASYKVYEAFGSYSVGDAIQDSVYKSLSDADKKKCASMIINLAFDPTVVQIDMTNRYYMNALASNEVTFDDYYIVKEAFGDYIIEDIISKNDYNSLSAANKGKCAGPYRYAKSLVVRLNPISSADINFYKSKAANNYSYPSASNPTPIISVSEVGA